MQGQPELIFSGSTVVLKLNVVQACHSFVGKQEQQVMIKSFSKAEHMAMLGDFHRLVFGDFTKAKILFLTINVNSLTDVHQHLI